jgi:phage gp29-like protein
MAKTVAVASTIAPVTVQEIVTNAVLSVQGLNAQAFSGSTNPSTIYRAMVENLPQVLPYYRELEEKDTCIASSFEVRKLLVMAREWNVVGADEENGQAELYREEAAAFLNSIPNFAFTLEELLGCNAYGYAVCEIYWKSDGNQVSVEKIIGRPQEFFDFRESLMDVPLGDLRYLQNLIPPGEEVPQEKFLVASAKPRHGDRRGLPLLRKLFWPSWFKRQGLRLYLQYLEKGQGTIAVGYSDSAGTDEKNKALAAAQAIAEEIAVAIPNSMKILESLLSNTRHHDGNDYRTLLEYQDAEMTRMILGQTLSTRGSEQNVGTQALGTVHQDLMFEIVKSDTNNLSTVIDEQLLKPWLRWTFGDVALDRAFRPHFRIDTSPQEDVLEQARILKEARGLVDVTRGEAYERLGIREPEDGESLVNEPFQPIELGGIGQ